ncbi:sulfurtransferase [Roseibium sp. SCPC15]|uniref:sulfurtransferase n=1 Tax=Roseibium sp. SCP15 TaxID=3141376 RepID=UPI00333C7AD6
MTSLVNCDWVARHASDPKVRLIEINWDGLDDYEAAHVPGALGWNWKEALWDPLERNFPTEHDFAARLGDAGISADTTVVFYGAPVQFGTYAWWVFKLFGHADVRMLDGGKVRWQREGRAVTRDIPRVEATSYTIGLGAGHIRAGREEVRKANSETGTVILDHRSLEEYCGERVGLPGKPDVGAERYGRVPGARHVPFDSLLNDDTTFKSPEEIREIVSKFVTSPRQKVISYCRLAHRATLASFAMTELLGFENVRVYDGSWTEWGSMVGMPIER